MPYDRTREHLCPCLLSSARQAGLSRVAAGRDYAYQSGCRAFAAWADTVGMVRFGQYRAGRHHRALRYRREYRHHPPHGVADVQADARQRLAGAEPDRRRRARPCDHADRGGAIPAGTGAGAGRRIRRGFWTSSTPKRRRISYPRWIGCLKGFTTGSTIRRGFQVTTGKTFDCFSTP